MGTLVDIIFIENFCILSCSKCCSGQIRIRLCSAIVVNLTKHEASLQYRFPIVAVTIFSVYAEIPRRSHLKEHDIDGEEYVESQYEREPR